MACVDCVKSAVVKGKRLFDPLGSVVLVRELRVCAVSCIMDVCAGAVRFKAVTLSVSYNC